MVLHDPEFLKQMDGWGASFLPNLRLSEYTSLGVGGPADVKSVREAKISLSDARVYAETPSVPVAALPEDAGVYQDRVENYVTNEPAIDYTAKFLLLAAFYQPGEHGREKLTGLELAQEAWEV